MKYKAGDVVQVKSIEWYEQSKDLDGHVKEPGKSIHFNKEMASFCGKKLLVIGVFTTSYECCGSPYLFQDWMFEESEVPEEELQLVKNIVEDLDIGNYKKVEKIYGFEQKEWIQVVATKNFAYYWRVSGDRLLAVRGIGVFLIS